MNFQIVDFRQLNLKTSYFNRVFITDHFSLPLKEFEMKKDCCYTCDVFLCDDDSMF